MKKYKKFMYAALMVACLSCLFCQPAFAAISESDVQSQVDAVGKETVSGNVLIWFLCAVAFLKISQKIDSFMASLGVNVGHTGGSMLAEAMIATRGIGGIRNFSRQHFSGGGSRSSTNVKNKWRKRRSWLWRRLYERRPCRSNQPQYYQQCRKDSDNLIGIQAIGQYGWSGRSSTGSLRWRWR